MVRYGKGTITAADFFIPSRSVSDTHVQPYPGIITILLAYIFRLSSIKYPTGVLTVLRFAINGLGETISSRESICSVIIIRIFRIILLCVKNTYAY